MKKGIVIFSLFCSILLTSTFFSGCVEEEPSSSLGLIQIPMVTAGSMNDPDYKLASFYSEPGLSINATSTDITLPIKSDDVSYFTDINELFGFSNDQKELFEKNGFVVIPFEDNDDMISSYSYLKNQDIPLYITTDTFLHLYHIQFNEILKGLEQRLFYQQILDMSQLLFDHSIDQYTSFTDPLLKQAAKDNAAFFAVALELLHNPTNEDKGSENIPTVDYSIPNDINTVVEQEISLIEGHDGFTESPLFSYKEDYSQYVPRGHYTDSELLRRYFKTLMWYGRMSFLLKGGEPACASCDFLVNTTVSNQQTVQSVLISSALANISFNERSLLEVWDDIYAITAFFVGTADDLTPQEYIEMTEEVFGSSFKASLLTNESLLTQLKGELNLLRKPQIYGGTGEVIIEKPPGVPFTLEDLNETLEKTQGMRLMGQRFIPDSYMFQQLVFPAVDPYTGSGNPKPFTMEITDGGPARVFPRGLDIMNVLGSDQASYILEEEGDTEYTRYDSQIRKLQQNFSSFNVTEWHRNLYFSWLYSLQPLLEPYAEEYPYYMQTDAWEQKSLHTALSSWTELRHDTILYAKQSYTPVKLTSIEPLVTTSGFVEPAVEVYVRLQALTNMTLHGLQSFNVLNATEENRLYALVDTLDHMIDLSIKELEGEAFSESDERFLADIDETLETTVLGVNAKGKETTLVADVHTDTNTNQVLEEGLGYVDMIVVAVPDAKGDLVCAAGPTLSCYEFKHPMNDRLTDEAWKEMLATDDIPNRPDWIRSFFAE